MGGKNEKFSDHIIICGLGATAIYIIEELESSREEIAGKDSGRGGHVFREYLVIDNSEGGDRKNDCQMAEDECRYWRRYRR